ncbi:MAG TPA: hypothetical protein VHV75_00860, partial [Solirubrobacteraceae bacterium]|nr:hypothetical protein [Solirubrobacteraceae bacterium]
MTGQLLLCPDSGVKCQSACPQRANDKSLKCALIERRTSLTAWLKRAANRFNAFIGALAVIAGAVTSAGPSLVLDRLGIPSGDDVGFSAQSAASHTVALYASLLATGGIAYVAAVLLTARAGYSEKIRKQAIRPGEYRSFHMSIDFGRALVIRVVRAELALFLLCAGMVGYESHFVSVAMITSGGTALVFAVLFWGLVVLTVALGIASARASANPASLRPLVLRMLAARAWYHRNRVGMPITMLLMVTAAAGLGSLAAGVAVSTQLRAGYSPGILGGIIGVTAPCEIVDSPGFDHIPALVVGQTDHATVAIENGVVHFLPRNLVRHI